MKKFLVVVSTAFVLVVSLMALTGPSGQAAPAAAKVAASPSTTVAGTCSYPACIPTRTKIRGKKRLKPGCTVRVKIRTRALQGTALPVGQQRVVVRRKNGGFKDVRTVPYRGKVKKIVFGPLPRGTYKAASRYIPRAGTVFQKSKSRYQIKVRPKYKGCGRRP